MYRKWLPMLYKNELERSLSAESLADYWATINYRCSDFLHEVKFWFKYQKYFHSPSRSNVSFYSFE